MYYLYFKACLNKHLIVILAIESLWKEHEDNPKNRNLRKRKPTSLERFSTYSKKYLEATPAKKIKLEMAQDQILNQD